MRLHRFFIEEQLRNKKEVTIREDELVHQLKDVFRLHSGGRLVLLDNSGLEFLAEVVVLSKNEAEMKIIDNSASLNIPKRDVWLFAALIKKDNFEWIVEKGTEIGISHFVPVLSDRTEKKDLNEERTQKILKEASEQSGRGTMPELHEILKFDEVFDFAKKNDIKLLAFHLEGQAFSTFKDSEEKNVRLGIMPEALGILIGPEGGWSEPEIELLKSENVPMYSLGKQVLRAETAAIAVSSLLLLG